MHTGRKILNLRCDRRISQQDLAKACSITPSALSKIEAGINSPRANIIWKIARHLGVTVEFLLDENIPYPYSGYAYRQDLLESNVDPSSTVRTELTREERAFLEALRESHEVAREVAYAIPELPVETLRLVHFLVHHSKVSNPDAAFLRHFENLVSTGKLEVPEKKGPAESKSTSRKTARGRTAKAKKGRKKVR